MKFIFLVFIYFPIFADQEMLIRITQTPCQFLELESENFSYQSNSEKDCEAINSNTLEKRKKNFKPLKLKAGSYKFIVSNKGVPYEVGFWLRGTGLKKIFMPSISGGGLFDKQTKEYSIQLSPGNYKISCPLNPTPDYDLLVE